MKRRSAVQLMAAIWLLISLACNLPQRQPSSPDLPVEALRQTLAAGDSLTTTVSPTVAGSEASIMPASGLATATPGLYQPGETGRAPKTEVFTYYIQPGDTLDALARRFGVNVDDIASLIAPDQPLPSQGLLPAGQSLLIPNRVGEGAFPSAALPDSEIIYGPSAIDFDIQAYVAEAGGYLSTYNEIFQGEQLSGVESVRRVALESSVNPRLLLALLEFRSGWVWGQPADQAAEKYPIGFHVSGQSGLYRELVMTATHLNTGYYNWRSGQQIQIKFQDSKTARLSPTLNAGSVAVQHLLAKFYPAAAWPQALYGEPGFLALYQRMFGDPWSRAAAYGPLFSAGLIQPTLELPFQPGERWSLTGGPHPAWKTGSPRGALDFAPVTGEAECAVSRAWALSAAAGLVVRSQRNVVAIDLDGDGYEGTGWVIIYLHLADKERVAVGTWVQVDDRLGHPSCEGGTSTGAHVHIARKFNGEWLLADGPLPFVLSGWVVQAGEKNYQGELRKNDLAVVASPVGPQTSIIVR